MQHTIAYFEATDRAATDNDEAALTGTADYVQNGHHVLPIPLSLIAAICLGTSSSRCRLDAPVLRQRSQFDLWPVERALIPSTPARWMNLRDSPIKLRPAEEIVVKHSGNGVTGTNENWTTVLFVGDEEAPVRGGSEITDIQATGTTTLVANAWTNVPLTFSETLPSGVWEIVGLAAQSTNLIAARLVIPGQWNRPGCIGGATIAGFPTDAFMRGVFGTYGRFNTTALPSIECLANGADTAETVQLKLRKVA